MHKYQALLMAGVLALAGCARSGSGAGAADPGAAFPDRATVVATAWQAATAKSEVWKTRIVALQSMTVAAGKLPDDARFRAGSGVLPPDSPAPAGIALPDGTSVTAPLVNAATAYAELEKAYVGGPCTEGVAPPMSTPSGGPGGAVGGPAVHTCTPLTVTSATLGKVELRTNRGLLQVPAWVFKLDGPIAQVSRVAVAPAFFGAPPEPEVAPWDEPDAGSVNKLLSTEPRRIEFTIGVSACSSDPVGYVHETADAVIVSGWAKPQSGPCIGALKLVPVTVQLNAPLAARVILDGVTGRLLV